MVLQPNDPERKQPSETEHSSESLPDFAFEAGDISPFAEAIGEFDRSQERMREIFLSIAENNTHSTENHTDVATNLSESLRAFAMSAHMIIHETPDDRTRDTTLVHLLQGAEANRHNLLAEIDPQGSKQYTKFDQQAIQNEVEVVFFESRSEAEKIERLTVIFHDMAEYDIRTIFAHINELQEQRIDAIPEHEADAEETEVSPGKVHPLLKRRFGRRAMIGATIAAGTGGALFAQLMNLRFR